MFSDLPALQNLIEQGIIDRIDLDDFEIQNSLRTEKTERSEFNVYL